MGEAALIEAIELCLPQTQCGACGHPGCTPYAEAIACGDAINRCAPGGERTIDALALLLGRDPAPLDPAHGPETPPRVAFVREAECIGCVKCIAACPVDAILGAAQRMHTVLAELCTGCGLCLPPCPVDCIDLLPVAAPPAQAAAGYLHGEAARAARQRWQRRGGRLARERAAADAAREERRADARRLRERAGRARRVQEAVERVKAKKLASAGPHAAAVAAAIERAHAKTLLRVMQADATAPRAPAPVTREYLLKQRAITARKLERAAQKRAEVEAEGDAQLLEVVLRAQRELTRRLAKIEAELIDLPV